MGGKWFQRYLVYKKQINGQKLISLMHVQLRPVSGARALELPTQYHHLDPSNRWSAVKLLQYRDGIIILHYQVLRYEG